MRQSKDHQTVIKQQPAPSPTLIKASGILPMPGDDDMGQHIRPINKTGPQEIFVLMRKEDWFKYSHRRSCMV